MKKILLLVLVCTMGCAYTSKASSIYQVNDAQIEATLNQATPTTIQITDAAAMVNPLAVQASSSDKNAWIAVILDFVVGGLAIHRVYLGGTPMLIVYYLITCGGIFGIVPLVDFVVLIINNEDISKYVGSNKFFMWG
ncbi:MAG: TM2 domain-containing protein [Bacteroidetes bacterium]|nr:TM2 domain-containing protein [Bacteroidota bacterium]